ncbi:potassium channel family protein [Lachnospiraceae bacterium C1.1]|nr:TrkA family potassium uptake protein [Lachnospiraceae bacterium C1.1]
MKKSIAILGAGKYGSALARALYGLGQDVLVVDSNEQVIKDIADDVTSAVCADLESEDELEAVGIQNMDIVVTTMSGNLSASILSVSLAKEMKVPLIISKASSPRMASILKRVGADKIIDPEEDGGMRSARILASRYINDYFEIDNNLCMVEITPKKEWIGQSLSELNLRKKHNLNVAAIKEENKNWSYVDPTKAIKEGNKLLVIIEIKDLNRLDQHG